MIGGERLTVHRVRQQRMAIHRFREGNRRAKRVSRMLARQRIGANEPHVRCTGIDACVLEDVSEAIVLADYAVMVVRPTLLDIAGLARTLTLVRRLAKPSTVVVNQAPTARENIEPPLVKRALRGLDYMQAPMAPVIRSASAGFDFSSKRRCVMPFVLLLNRSGNSRKKSGASDVFTNSV